MRNYNEKAGSLARVMYGDDLVMGLGLFEETNDEGKALAELTDAMFEGALTVLKLERAQAKARAAVRIAEYEVQQLARRCMNDAKNADGGSAGLAVKELFPDGLDAVIRPRGASQHKAGEELLGRLAGASSQGGKSVADAWRASLSSAISDLADTLASRDEADKDLHDTYAKLAAQGAAHRREVDRLMGIVRAAFPQDRVRQDAVFPERPRRAKKADTPEG